MSALQNLFQKEMSGKEFVTTAFFGVAAIFGFGTILELLGKTSPLHDHMTDNEASYNAGFYSGFKKES